MKFFVSAFLLLAFALIFAQTNFAAGNIDPTFNVAVTDGLGYVQHTVVQPDGKIIVFGSFQKVLSGRYNNIARLNPNGTPDTGFNGTGSGANSYILAAVLQTDGKIIIGGNFTAFNGQAINRLARLNANGSLDTSFNPTANFNNAITDIVIQPDGKILVCGRFAGGTQSLSSGIARFNADGSIDGTFQNNLGTNRAVLTIALQSDGKVLIGGEFSEIAGTSRPSIARLNADGSIDNSFSGSGGGTIHKILIQPDGKLLLAGEFFSRAVKRLNADGSPALTASRPDAASTTVEAGYDVALQPDGKVLVAYGFGASGNITDYSVIRLNADLTSDTSFFSSYPDRFPITDINLLSDGNVIVSGSFITLNNAGNKRYIAKILPNGELDPGFDSFIRALGRINVIKHQPDGKILIGGIFERINGSSRRTNIARLNADGSVDNSFNPSPTLFDYMPNWVFDIELQPDGKILVGRYRLSGLSIALAPSGDGLSKGAIIRLNADGSLDESFQTIVTHWVRGIAVSSDNKIFVGGYLENLHTPPFGTEAFRKLMTNGNVDTAFNPAQPNIGSVYEILEQPDGKILISGVFTTVGGSPRVGTARYNADGTLDSGYNAALPNIYTLGLATDGKIYAGGSFPISGGNVNQNIARLMPNGSIDSSFVGLANAAVRDLIVQPDGKIIIGGDFTSYYSNQVGRLARVNINGSFDPTFETGAGASGTVYAVERQTDGKILVGGQFLDFDGVEKFGLVRLQNQSVISPFDFDGDSKTDISIFRPSNGQWWYQRSSNSQTSAFQFGASNDNLAPADFTGDGKTDIAVWRESTGEWFVMRSEDNSFYSFPFGTAGDTPVPADFDGDARADAGVYRASNQTWYIQKSTGGTYIEQFGTSGDLPVPTDYDGDGRADIAIFRPSNGQWWLNRSSAGIIALTFGVGTDKPVQGDFTGDGKADAAFWRPSSGEWFVLRSEDYSYYASSFGIATDIPTPGDYDGDGRFDTGVFRPSSNTWFVQRSTAGTLIQNFGMAGDLPVPAAFVP